MKKKNNKKKHLHVLTVADMTSEILPWISPFCETFGVFKLKIFHL